MGFFDTFDKFLEKAEKFVDEVFPDDVVSNKTIYSEDTLMNKCKNDRSILRDALLSNAQAFSKETVELDWDYGQIGTCTIKEVSDGIYFVTINGSVHGRDKFGNFSKQFEYTKKIYIDKYGVLDKTIGQSYVIVNKKY